MILEIIVIYLILGLCLAILTEAEESGEFYAWLLFWPIVVGLNAIKELIEICIK